jgi:ribonuclease J
MNFSSCAYYIAASTEPFNDEMYIDEEKFMNWLDKFDVDYEYVTKNGKKVFERRHISGHASQPEIIELVDKLKPNKIIPVHTENPEKFTELFGDEYEVILPEFGEENHI